MIRVGSVFSGWGVCEMVLEAFQDCWNQMFPEFKFEAMRLRNRPVYCLLFVSRFFLCFIIYGWFKSIPFLLFMNPLGSSPLHV